MSTPLETLESFGLDEKESRLYLALIELGKASILQLSRKSGLERSGIYYLLRGLRRRGLVRETYDKNNVLYLVPAPPERLMQLEEERHQALKTTLPELKALYANQPAKPRVQIFEGAEGMDALYDDILATLKYLPNEKKEVLNYASAHEILALPMLNQTTFRKNRIAAHIRFRIITSDSPEARDFQSRDAEELRQSRILPETHGFGAAQLIYGDKVAQYSVRGELFVLLVEHKELAALQRRVFELAWTAA